MYERGQDKRHNIWNELELDGQKANWKGPPFRKDVKHTPKILTHYKAEGCHKVRKLTMSEIVVIRFLMIIM